MTPVLPFNDIQADHFLCFDEYANVLMSARPQFEDFTQVNRQQPFVYKRSSIAINELVLSAGGGSDVRFGKKLSGRLAFLLPLSGLHFAECKDKTHTFLATKSILLSGADQHTLTLCGAGAALYLDTKKIKITCSSMLGSDFKKDVSEDTRIINVLVGNVSYHELFMSQFLQIDAAGGNATILSKLALDDSFYRLCAGLLYPDVLFADETRNGRRPYVRPEVNRLCEYIAAHLTEAISLTKMESMSGLSARILQRSFQKAFGLTPKQWVRKQRLHAARSAMQKNRGSISITSISYDFCFASPSDFAHHYALEFGEQPSRTLGRIIPSGLEKSSVDFGK